MKRISLSGGGSTIVDNDVYRTLSHLSWRKNTNGYAHWVCNNGKGSAHILLHRLILSTPYGYYVDHVNGNRLDNRRCNLRVVTNQINQLNRGKKDSGVHRYNGKWRAHIYLNGHDIGIGIFVRKRDAIAARKKKLQKVIKELCSKIRM